MFYLFVEGLSVVHYKDHNQQEGVLDVNCSYTLYLVERVCSLFHDKRPFLTTGRPDH